jgi:DNA helicase-2/ATP-dependent DNA helicase PcrA
MQQQVLTQWLKQQQPVLEKIILESAQKFVAAHEGHPNFGYDLQCAQTETYNLTQGTDLCYDRYTTPVAYSLWYQARRINTFITLFQDKLLEACQSGAPVEVFDLGAGTGCVQLCFGLVSVACQRLSKAQPMLRIINVDSSPFMLEYLRSYLWPQAIQHYPELKNLPVEYHVYSWSNKQELSVTNPWICASYLFDSSENKEYLEYNFNELIKAFDPAKILMLTSAQPNKREMMETISVTLRKQAYKLVRSAHQNPVFQGTLEEVTAYRAFLKSTYHLQASHDVSWSDNRFAALALEKAQSGFAFNTDVRPEGLDLFNPPLRVRREVQLNDMQKKAARFEEVPSVIIGPAGCGKSIVITEKIINILEHYQWRKPLHILVTTFNKLLLKQLRAWLCDLLESRNMPATVRDYKQPPDGTGFVKTGEQECITIELMNFETLPGMVGHIGMCSYDRSSHIEFLEKVIQEVRTDSGIRENVMQDVLNPAFIMEEYHRVIFGLQCRIELGEDHYQQLPRTGRGQKLDRGDRRKAVWQVLKRYESWMYSGPWANSFTGRRQQFLDKLKATSLTQPFDYVFVDEFQDCTQADFEIMSRMLSNVNNLVIGGDLAQAVHIGKTGAIPRDEAMSRRKKHVLKGSYRLPYRICEAIHPLSKYITSSTEDKEGTEEITPYKGAPPGARPIFLYAGTNGELAAKLVHIKQLYAPFSLHSMTILEADQELCKCIAKLKHPVETSTILKLKGLEKEFVVWSLQAGIEFEKEVFEFAYTIMTRTNCLLVIAASPAANPVYFPVLRHLTENRIIFWDESSHSFFSQAKERRFEMEMQYS